MEKKLRLTAVFGGHAAAQIFWVGQDGILTYATESTCRRWATRATRCSA